MKNKLIILLLFISGFAFGQHVPDTHTFSLDSVTAVVGGNSLRTAFDNAVPAYFDPTYVGDTNSLYSFRNYTVTTFTKPTVTTWAIGNITETTATSGGDVTDDGGEAVTARGVCWNTSGNPSLADSYSLNGSGTGSFSSGISSLHWGTKYYVRAYATNSVGTGYGNEIAFYADVASGRVQYASVGQGLIEKSTDFGVTWSQTSVGTAAGSESLREITVSRTGMDVTMVKSYYLSSGSYTNIYISNNGLLSAYWSSKLIDYPVRAYRAPNSNEQTLVSNALEIGSADAIITTTDMFVSNYYSYYVTGTIHDAAISSNGNYITYVGTVNKISNDGGTSFDAILSGTTLKACAMSGSGQYQTVVSSTLLLSSSDYGATWYNRATGTNWSDIDMDATGQYQTAVDYGGDIWRSTDYGDTWTDLDYVGIKNWYRVSVSADGQYQTVVVSNGYIYTSSDYGANWIQRIGVGNWVTIAINK